MSLRIIEWSDFLKSSGPQKEESAVTIGVFDGLHLGHTELISKIVRRGPNPTVFTFRENPKKVISPETYEGDIFSLRQKIAAIESLGVSNLILIDFSEKISKLNGWEFIDLLEDRVKVVFMAIGGNFRCGYRQDTDAEFIREMNERKGIPTEVVSPVVLPEVEILKVKIPEVFGIGPVSSSRIRSEIISGNIKLASALMGHSVEADLSDLKPVSGIRKKQEGLVYNLRSVHRIAPSKGQFPILMYPGAAAGQADAENGMIFISTRKRVDGGQDSPLERIEFISEYPI